MKLASGILLALCVLILFFRRANRYQIAVKELSQTVDFISDCKTQIRYQRTPRNALIEQGKQKYPLVFENHKESNIVSDFLDQLGTTDVAGQIALCERCLIEAERIRSLRDTTYRNTEKLYRTLGIFGAAAILIIFI